jgi:hypothetical protein
MRRWPGWRGLGTTLQRDNDPGGTLLRIFEERAGRPEPVCPAQPGRLRTFLALPADNGGSGQPGPAAPQAAEPQAAEPLAAALQVAGLRAALLADLVRRVAERHHLHVTAWQAALAQEGCWQDLNIHPAQVAPVPPGQVDLGFGVAGPAGQLAVPAVARWVRVAPVTFPGGGLTPYKAAPAVTTPGRPALPGRPVPGVSAIQAAGLDPLALRLALLEYHYRQPVTLGWDTLAAADQALRAWRDQVADWARSPSQPMPARYLAAALAAFDDDLDSPAALATLRTLAADEAQTAGAKFEAFAYSDRLLGLDLAREVGR